MTPKALSLASAIAYVGTTDRAFRACKKAGNLHEP